jgi:uncharacterized membrane protein
MTENRSTLMGATGRTTRYWRLASLMGATVTMGLMAGLFGDWAVTIMPGLHTTDDRTFVGAFQAIEQAFNNAPFMLTFTGALGFTAVAAVLHMRGDDRSPLPWVAAAFGLYLVAFVLTVVVHVPLNDAIVAAGDPDRITDLGAVRDAFDETRWANWHAVRTVATIAAFGCLLWALVLHGRAGIPQRGQRPW